MEVLISNGMQTDKAAHDYVLHGFADVYVLFDDIRTTYRWFVSPIFTPEHTCLTHQKQESCLKARTGEFYLGYEFSEYSSNERKTLQ